MSVGNSTRAFPLQIRVSALFAEIILSGSNEAFSCKTDRLIKFAIQRLLSMCYPYHTTPYHTSPCQASPDPAIPSHAIPCLTVLCITNYPCSESPLSCGAPSRPRTGASTLRVSCCADSTNGALRLAIKTFFTSWKSASIKIILCSMSASFPRIGAGGEYRTHDLRLGKATLIPLSYTRLLLGSGNRNRTCLSGSKGHCLNQSAIPLNLKPRLSVVVTLYRGPVAFTSTSEAIFGRLSWNQTTVRCSRGNRPITERTAYLNLGSWGGDRTHMLQAAHG